MNPHTTTASDGRARLTVDEAAADARRSSVTIRRALAAGELHGTQRIKRGRWTIARRCLDAWADNTPCEHQAPAVSNVVDLATHRSAS